MRRLLTLALTFLLPALSFAQAGPVPGGSGGGSSTITSGTTATSGCVAGGVLRSISNLVECGAGITWSGGTLTLNNGVSAVSPLEVQDNGSTSFAVRDGSTVQIGGTTSDRYMLMTGYGGASGYQGTIAYPADFAIGFGTTTTPTATLKLPGFSDNNSYLYGGQSKVGAVVQVGGGSNNGLGANIFAGTEYALTSGTATEVVTIALSAGLATGGNITYTVFASDGTDMQARSGEIRFALVNKAGTETCAVYGVDNAATVNPDQTQDGSSAGAFSAGTLTYVWSVDTSGSNSCVLKLAATSSLGAPPTVLRMNFNAHLKGPGTMTLSST